MRGLEKKTRSLLRPLRFCSSFVTGRSAMCAVALWMSAFSHAQLFSQPLAYGKSKFLGNVVRSGYSIRSDFSTYWNQVTPENAGKWGSVEGSQGFYNWTELDNIYNYALANSFPYKHHTLIWGSQYPGWINSLDSATLHQEIVNWIMLTGQRYPNADFCDVVNEPLHTPLPAIFKTALGGNGVTGWDWVINAFQLARQYWSSKTKLLINEYSVVNDPNANAQYLQIINLLKTRGLIDGIGVQAHYFEVDGGALASVLKKNLDSLTATGLPVYASEFDINQQNDATQAARYQQFFGIFWENPGVHGITLWGYSQNETWKPYTYLVTTSGSERPALQWLRTYMKNGPTPSAPVLLSPVNATNVPRQATFVWHSSPLATSYNFQIALDDAFQLVVEDTTLADTTKTIGFALDSTTIFRWRVCGIDSAGSGLYSSTAYFLTGTVLAVKEGDASPKEFALFQNYPNPFNPVTQINYVVPQYGFVSLKVYSVIGQEVATLYEGIRQPGTYTSTFDGSGLGSGVYFCRMTATNFNASRKLVLIK